MLVFRINVLGHARAARDAAADAHCQQWVASTNAHVSTQPIRRLELRGGPSLFTALRQYVLDHRVIFRESRRHNTRCNRAVTSPLRRGPTLGRGPLVVTWPEVSTGRRTLPTDFPLYRKVVRYLR